MENELCKDGLRKMNPTVSVIITTYNGSTRGFLEQAIESVLKQTYSDYELIIVDDGSTDQTLTLCEKYANGEKVRVITQTNAGPSAARNAGIRSSRGTYICFLDDDDLYEPTKLQEQVDFFLSHPDKKVGLLYTAVTLIDGKGCSLGLKGQMDRGDIYEKLFFGNYITGPSTVMIPNAVFDDVGLFREELLSSEDYEMWLRITKKYAVWSLGKPLVRYRVHTNSLSHNTPKMHFYHGCTLYIALAEAPASVQKLRNRIMYAYNLTYAAQYLGFNEFSAFRTQYKIAAAYQPHSIGWKIRYLLSCVPPLFLMIKQLRNRRRRESCVHE